MSGRCTVQIDDAAVVVVDEHGVRVESPAFAVATAEGLEVGAAARARARIDPRRTVDRFWERLDQDALPTPLGVAKTRADLAFAHLRAAWAEASVGTADVLLALPATFSREARALAVGIAHAVPLPLVGVVESSVAAAATIDAPGPRTVVEVGLHRVTATRVVAEDDGTLALDELRTIASRGLDELVDALATSLAAAFVREARFDPLHDAATEQLLHDRIPKWLAAAALTPSAPVELAVGGRRYAIEASRGLWDEVASTLFAEIAATLPSDGTVLVGPRLAGLPDALDALGAAARRAGSTLRALDAAAIGRAAIAHEATIRSDPKAPAFVTRLPGPMPGASRPTPEASDGPLPTHLLVGWHARPVGGRPLLLGEGPPRELSLGESAHGCLVRRRGGDVVLEAPPGSRVFVNGRPVEGEAVLRLGDVVRVGDGDEHRLIRVGGVHATS